MGIESRLLFITSSYILYLITVYLFHKNQNTHLLQILNGTMALIGSCVLIRLYYSLKKYNSKRGIYNMDYCVCKDT